jgi:hypothetical protein
MWGKGYAVNAVSGFLKEKRIASTGKLEPRDIKAGLPLHVRPFRKETSSLIYQRNQNLL